MAQPGIVKDYIERLVLLGRAAHIDAERLAAEVADHLSEAASRYQSVGATLAEAERRAVEDFGEVEILVSAVASCRKGGVMARLTRSVATTGALLATAALLGIHMDWDSAASGTPVQAVVVTAGVLLAVSIAVLVAIRTRTRANALFARRSMVWLAACAALGIVSSWEGPVALGPVHLHLTGRPYLATIAFVAVLVSGAARWMRFEAGTGLGLVVAGALSLLLNGALTGGWRPLGSIGEGQANLGMELILIGWLFASASWITGAGGAPARARVGGWLVALGQRIALTAREERETGSATSL